MHRFLLVAALLPLAACNSGPTVSATNASEAEVKAKVAAATGAADMIAPGRWEGTMTISDMKMPKLPPDQQAKLAGRMGQPQKFVSCVTEEDVKAKRAFFTGDKDSDKSCTYSRFTMGGGKIDAAMACKNPGGTMNATMTGNFSPDSYHMDMASNTDSASPYAAMSMKITVDGKRTGACRGTERQRVTMGVTMHKTMMTAGIAAMLLAGCAKGPPPKREPGSWSQTMELKRFEGKDADKAKAALGQMFAAMNAVTVCVTPEMAAKEDPTANLEKLGSGGGTCTFDRKSAAGGTLDVAGTCKDAAGKSAKITATGTIGATDQDIDMVVEGFDPFGTKEGLMEVRVHSVRKGECTASDMRPKTM